MHPYRDKEDLADIRENIETIRDDFASVKTTLENLKLSKQSAIGQAIGHKIERFHLGDFVFGLIAFVAVIVALSGGAYCLYMNATTPDDAITSCYFDFINSHDREDGIRIKAVIDWHDDEWWGPFENIKEAKLFAKENGCPNRQDN